MTLNHIMNEQLHEHLNTLTNDCLGFGALDIDFSPNLKISLNLKKSMSNLYFKDLKSYLTSNIFVVPTLLFPKSKIKVKKTDCGLSEIWTFFFFVQS